MVFNTALYMQGGVTISYLESIEVTKIAKLYNKCVKHSRERDK